MFINPFIPAALFVALISASYKVQFQALMYLLAVIYAVHDINQFMVTTVLYIVGIMFHLMRSAGSGKG